MAVKAQRVTVADTATRLDTMRADTPTRGGDPDGLSILIRNRHATTSMFIGGDDVDTDAGFELVAGAAFGSDLKPGDQLYGVVASGTVDCDVIQVGV